MIRWAEVPRGSLGDELTAASEAHAIARCLAEQGVDASSPLLRRGGPVSVHHQLSVLKEASQCARDPLIAVRVGLGLHPTSYGIAGLLRFLGRRSVLSDNNVAGLAAHWQSSLNFHRSIGAHCGLRRSAAMGLC